MKHIALKKMLDILVECIINQKEEYPTFYYKREYDYIEITEVDLLQGEFRTIDGDFSEFSWEIEKSNIYMEVEECEE